MSRQTSNQGHASGGRTFPFGQDHKPGPKGNNTGGGGGEGGGGGDLKCFNCQKFGHIARDCPKKYDDGRGNTRLPNPEGFHERRRGYPGEHNRGEYGREGEPRGFGPTTIFPQLSTETLRNKDNEDALVVKFKDIDRTAVAKPFRPGYGTLGQQVEVSTNYFAMDMKASLVLYHYSITQKAKQIIKLMLNSQDFVNRTRSIVTDFQLNLVSLEKLPEDIRNQKIDYFHEADGATRTDAQTYNLHIAPVKESPALKISDLVTFLTSDARTAEYPARLPMIQALNILIGHYTNSTPTTTMIGGKRAFPQNTDSGKYLGAGLIAERGFFSSVRFASYRTLVNVNISHGAFYKPIELTALMVDFGVQPYEALETFVKGLKVKTNYLRDKLGKPITMIRTISGFAHLNDGYGQNPRPQIDYDAGSPFQVWFYLKDSAEFAKLTTWKFGKYSALKDKPARRSNYISVGEFFGEKHNVRSDENETYPVVNVGTRKDPRYIPAEACTVERGQLSRLKLSPQQTTAMLNFAKLKPSDVSERIVSNGLPTMGLCPRSPQMDGFGVSVGKSMIKVLGRILSSPKIEYGNRKLDTSDGTWNLRDNPQFKVSGKPLRWWKYLAIASSKARVTSDVTNDPNLAPSIKALCKALRGAGIQTSEPKGGTYNITGSKDKFLANEIEKAAQDKLDILLIILPTKDTVLYNTIKQLADVRWGVPTVCVVGTPLKFYSCKVDYCANVALKFNLKLGGTNHVLCDPRDRAVRRVAIISENKTMVVGIDVTHPGPGSANPSIAAMVASIDADLAQWPAVLRVQIRTRQEMVALLGDMLKTRLDLWKTHHRSYPENILVYRDGVSESQYKQVLEEEFNLMQKACKSPYEMAKQDYPKFTLVIVGKRHHTRFFPPASSPARDGTGNPRCGLVVDRGITEVRNWDFFLQSHTSHLGTARPSHYYVLWDQIFTDPQCSSSQSGTTAADMLEQVTHDMCYLFGRATKAVSLCPPVYYADIACDRAGRYLADRSFGSESGRSDSEMNEAERERLCHMLQKEIEVDENLKDKMFYI